MSCARPGRVIFREFYPDGLRDWLACGHCVYATSLEEVEYRRCLLCLRKYPPTRGRPDARSRRIN